MEVTERRQDVLANNLANASTPGYIRREVDFRESLKRALDSGRVAQLDRVRPQTVEDLSIPPREDGNNVVVPSEMNAMMQNGITYSLLAKAFTSRLSVLKAAIKGA
jgi:flagellar basal-body rod protein FlgB